MHGRTGCRVKWVSVVAWFLVASASLPGADEAGTDDVAAAALEGQKLQQAGKLLEAIAQYEKAAALSAEVFGRDHLKTASMLHNLAQLYRDTGQYARAEPLFRRSLEIAEARLGKDHADVATILGSQALLYERMGQDARAATLYQRCLEIREDKLGEDHPLVGTTLTSLADLYTARRDHARAEGLYERAVEIQEKAKDPNALAHVLNQLAGLYTQTERYEKAVPLLLRALQVKEALLGPDHLDVATLAGNLGWAYACTNQFARAEPLLRRALRIREKELGPDHLDVARVLASLGGLYTKMGEYVQAETVFRRALRIQEARLGPNHLEVADTLYYLATNYLYLGEYTRAEPLFLRALRINEDKRGKDDPGLAELLTNLSAVYVHIGEHARAEPLLKRAEDILTRKLGKNHPRLEHCLFNQAALYVHMGQYYRAETLYMRCLEITEARKGENDPHVALTLEHLGALYIERRDFARAAPLYERSLRIVEARLGKDHPDVARSLSHLAGVYGNLNQYARAEPLYRRCLAIEEAKLGKDHPYVGSTLNNLAVVYEHTGRRELARFTFERGLRILQAKLGDDHPSVASCHSNMGLLYATAGEWTAAADAFDRAARATHHHVTEFLIALSDPEQMVFLRTQFERDLHGSLSLGLLRHNDPRLAERSAEWLLNGKAVAGQAVAQRTLLSRDSTNPELADLVQSLKTVRAQLARLALTPSRPEDEERQLQEREQCLRTERSLSKRLGQAGGSLRPQPWVELTRVRRALPRDGVLVEFVRMEVREFPAAEKEKLWQPARYVAWVIPAEDQGAVAVVDLGAADQVEAAVRAALVGLRAAQEPDREKNPILQNGEPEAEKQVRGPLETLARLVLHPVLKHAGSARQLVLCPDASLWLVPWAALPLPDGRYAVEGYTIRYVNSGRDLVAQPPSNRPTRAYVLADPDYDLGLKEARIATEHIASRSSRAPEGPGRVSAFLRLPRVGRLPGTAREAEAIRPLLDRFAGEQTTVYEGAEALEAACKAIRHPRVLVLATHGFFLADQETARPGWTGSEVFLAREGTMLLENPLLRCGLLLAGCNQREQARNPDEDGVLTGLEIVGMDLRGCELVVLSACDTGVGDVRNGEGVAGLRQAFQLAGARSVLATLWQIDDRRTARLMTEFFRGLATGQGKAEALRQAQLLLIQRGRGRNGAAHPFFWAAFTLTGQGK